MILVPCNPRPDGYFVTDQKRCEKIPSFRPVELAGCRGCRKNGRPRMALDHSVSVINIQGIRGKGIREYRTGQEMSFNMSLHRIRFALR